MLDSLYKLCYNKTIKRKEKRGYENEKNYCT